MKYNPDVWGPHYWFFLLTTALSYPHSPTNITKKKYYNLIRDFHLFIPDTKIGKEFDELIMLYPVSPYLDNRNSFVRWVNFIHNQINKKLKKNEMSLKDALHKYYSQYIPDKEPFMSRDKIVFCTFISLFIVIVIYLYQK